MFYVPLTPILTIGRLRHVEGRNTLSYYAIGYKVYMISRQSRPPIVNWFLLTGQRNSILSPTPSIKST